MTFKTRVALMWISAGLLLPASLKLDGQSIGTLSGPILGYLFNAPEGQLRPLRGVLGSTSIGDPLNLDFSISQALALDANHFIISTSSRQELLAISLDDVPVSVNAISGAPSDPTIAAASTRGAASAFYYAGSQRILIVGGPSGHPAILQTVDLSQFNGAPLTKLAVSDDGALMVYSIAEADRESIYVCTSGMSSSRFVFSVVSVGGIALADNGDAVISDRSADEVFAIVDTRNTAIPRFLMGARDGLSRPADVAVSLGNQILIANRGSATVMTVDFNGRVLRSEHCNCEVSGLYLVKDSVFRLTERLDRAMYLVEAGANGDRIWFVPALRVGP